MSKEYIIEKFTDILNIPENSFDNFIIDVKKFYEVTKNIEKINNIVTNGDEPIKVPYFKWIDDGKHNANITIQPTPTKQEEKE